VKEMKKILIPLLALLLLLCIPMPSHARKVTGLYQERIGNFTGPITGSAQDDNIKASLDLAHTDLDALIVTVDDTLSCLKVANSVWYVDSGVAGSAGTTWATAVATIDDAVNLATADVGDIIFVAPGHAENLGTTDPDVDKAGLTIIGLGVGEQRAVLSSDTSTDIFTIDADDVAVYNLVFLAHTPDVAKGIDITAGSENAIIQDCLFTVHTEATDEFLICINIGAASDNPLIKNNEFFMGGGNATEAILQDGTLEYAEIVGNKIYGDYSTACIYGDSTGAGEMLTIRDNILYNGDITIGLNTEPCIELKSDTTGFIVNNQIACNVAEPSDSIVAADCYLWGNKYTETEGIAGNLDIGLEMGKTYAQVMTGASVAASADDLFIVAGGPILITDFFGICTTAMSGNPGDMKIWCDATTADQDRDFSTTVTIDTLAVGDSVRFTNAIDEGVLDFTANMGAGQRLSWICPIGTIEQSVTSTGTGVVSWYMVFIPLGPNVTVASQ